MTFRIRIHNRIVIAIRKEVETANSFGIEIFDRVCVNESANFGIVVTGLEIIQTGFGIVIVASVAEGVYVGNGVCAVIAYKYCAFTPSIICIRSNKRAGSVVYRNYVALNVLAVVIIYTTISKADNAGKTVVIGDISCAAFLQDTGAVKGICDGTLFVTYTVCAVGKEGASVTCKSSYICPSEIVTAIGLGVTEELLFYDIIRL